MRFLLELARSANRFSVSFGTKGTGAWGSAPHSARSTVTCAIAQHNVSKALKGSQGGGTYLKRKSFPLSVNAYGSHGQTLVKNTTTNCYNTNIISSYRQSL